MLRRVALALGGLLLALAAGCGSGLPKSLEGDLYTQCRMVAVDNVLFTHPVTDRPGAVWKPGQKVRIQGCNAKALILETESGDEYYLWAEKDQAWNVANIAIWAPKFVDPNKPALTPALEALVAAGAAKPGMWRDEVVLAVGWPTRIGVSGPANNLGRDTLYRETTWRVNSISKGERLTTVVFEGNKVVKVD